MSTSLAIAAVTAKLRDLLGDVDKVVSGAYVTTCAPDKALEETGNRVNLFLYQTTVNTGWSNMDMPGRVKPGETGHPPLALNLHYLVTAYTQDDNDLAVTGHRLLGQAMSILHDNTVLDWDKVKVALPNAEAGEQIERVRLTPQPLSVDEISKLWTTFQTHYRPSAAYQASVVLIESARPVSTPLPVLRRGPKDEGVFADLLPFPTLTRLELPPRQPSLRLGETLTIHGHRLEGDPVKVRLRHPQLEAPVLLDPESGATGTKLTMQLPIADHLLYPAGFYTLAVLVTQQPEGRDPIERVTNELPFSLAPVITIPAVPMALAQNPDRAMLTLECQPEVWPEQQVSVLLDSFESTAEPHDVLTDTVRFDVSDVPVGEHLVRLRLDGVDSLPILNFEDSASPLAFDQSQKVTLIPFVIIADNPVTEDPKDSTRRLLTLKCRPDAWPRQEAVLLIDGNELEARARPGKTNPLAFDVTDLASGEYTIHLRVDGMTSAPDVEQKVTIP